MKVKFKHVAKESKTKVICDTNVWYGFNQGKPTETDEKHSLIPTSLSLEELASSEVMAHDIKLYQDTIKAIYEKCGPIITLNPIDYVLSQQDLNTQQQTEE